MKRTFLFLLIIFCGFHLQAQFPFDVTEKQPKREVRAVWLTTLSGLDWPKTKATSEKNRKAQQEELCKILDQLQECKINTVFLQTRVRGSVIYPSKIEPWDVGLTGTYDKDPGYDPLKFAIEETHRRGMELHAWVVTIPCFKIATAKKVGKKSLLNTHPQLLKRHEDTYYLDPGQPASGEYLTRICKEIVSQYDVDGIHFDYIRYPENGTNFPDAQSYRKYGAKQEKMAWRRDNITKIVRQTYAEIKKLKPWVRVSCSPVGKYRDMTRYSAKGWSAYGTVQQDAQGWLKEGIMDMLCPMMYFKGDHFYPFAADWQENSYGRTIAPGLGIYFLHPKQADWAWGDIQRELEYIREEGLQGQAYFRSEFLTDNTKGLFDFLKNTYYPYPALLPAMTWMSKELPQAPHITKKERIDGTKELVEWEKVEKEGRNCRYVVYASKEKPVDISKAENIVCTLKEPTYTYNLLSATLWNLNLAITTLDCFGNESEATPLY